MRTIYVQNLINKENVYVFDTEFASHPTNSL